MVAPVLFNTTESYRRELEVLCLPGEIPDSISLDISSLEIGDSLHVEDINVEGDIEIPAETNFTILTVTTPKVEAVEEEEVEEEEIPYRFRDHALFVSYAPAENPQIAVAVVVEHGGHGSSAAAPVAKAIYDAYFNGKPAGRDIAKLVSAED